jgi:hypothetical protein
MREKFPGEAVEQGKVKLREEEVYAEAERCPDCAVARRESGDDTALCEKHLRKMMGLS